MFEKNASAQASTPESVTPNRTVIGADVHLAGGIQGRSDMDLHGTVEGDIKLEGRLVVGDGGKLTGDVWATSVVVQGEVLGNITARRKVQLCSNSKMKGNLRANSLSIQEGALFEGRVTEVPAQSEVRELKETAAVDSERQPVYN
jgi:cytoskeletal protein CcmA (bactofilin family)